MLWNDGNWRGRRRIEPPAEGLEALYPIELRAPDDILARIDGGRAWWAHFEFTRINIEPIILRKKIGEERGVGALRGFSTCLMVHVCVVVHGGRRDS
jgi:hypothetical protein